jgi:hypothetical protein
VLRFSLIAPAFHLDERRHPRADDQSLCSNEKAAAATPKAANQE